VSRGLLDTGVQHVLDSMGTEVYIEATNPRPLSSRGVAFLTLQRFWGKLAALSAGSHSV
jgi:hypothetical protein